MNDGARVGLARPFRRRADRSIGFASSAIAPHGTAEDETCQSFRRTKTRSGMLRMINMIQRQNQGV
jgi:hypothetical protein